jgi:hypothetical protein
MNFAGTRASRINEMGPAIGLARSVWAINQRDMAALAVSVVYPVVLQGLDDWLHLAFSGFGCQTTASGDATTRPDFLERPAFRSRVRPGTRET